MVLGYWNSPPAQMTNSAKKSLDEDEVLTVISGIGSGAFAAAAATLAASAASSSAILTGSSTISSILGSSGGGT